MAHSHDVTNLEVEMTNTVEVTNSEGVAGPTWDPAFEPREPPDPDPEPLRDALVWRLETLDGRGPYIGWNIAQQAREALGLDAYNSPPWHGEAQPLWQGPWPKLPAYRYACTPPMFRVWWSSEGPDELRWLLRLDGKQLRCREYWTQEFHLSWDGRQGVFDPNRAKIIRLVGLKEALEL